MTKKVNLTFGEALEYIKKGKCVASTDLPNLLYLYAKDKKIILVDKEEKEYEDYHFQLGFEALFNNNWYLT